MNDPGSHRSSTFSRAVRWSVCDAPRDRLGTSLVARHRLSVECLGEVRADGVEVDRLDLDDRVAHLAVGLDDHERMSLEHGVADRDRDRPHDAAHRRLDDVLHLHRFHHEQRLA